MAVLPGHEILRLNAVLGVLDRTLQVQPAGIDLTVGEVYEFKGPGLLGFWASPATREECRKCIN
ncbi:MAG: hypothetical protein QW102_02220 [Candidatus Nezhaarchaeales archaeon]